MSLEQDVATARQAVDQLERACGRVTRHVGDTLDARRLRADLTRLRDDLDLLGGGAGRPHAAPSSATGTWGDGFDDGTVTTGRGRS
jgi:hypothetical protein